MISIAVTRADTIYLYRPTHRTIYNDTPVRRSQDERRKTLKLVACTICRPTPLSGVNHSSGSRHRLSPTYGYIIWAQ